MIKHVGTESPLGDEELRQWFQKYLEDHPHLTTTNLASQIGKSRAALDQYLAGKYFLPKANGGQGVDPKNSNIEPLLRTFRKKVDGLLSNETNGKTGFISTRTWYQVKKAIETAMDEHLIIVVYGPPGVGKTHALGHFLVENMVSTPIHLEPSPNVTVRYFVRKIAQQLKVDDRPSVPDIEDLIVAKLKQLPRPLFIDQANYLSDKMLGTCCKIWNETKVPVVLLGTKDLYDLFTSTRLTEDTRTQISTRISMYYQLQGLTLEELKTIVTDRLPPEAATDEVIAELQKLSFTVHRTLDNLLGNMLRIAKANEGKKLDWKQVAIKAAGRLIIV